MIKQKKILILGASRYYSKSIEAARHAGYFVILADRNSQSYAFAFADATEVCDIVDKEAVLEISKKHRISAIIPVNDYGVPTAAYVAAKLGLIGISEETAFWATNKSAMRKKWIESGIPCPRIELAETHEEAKNAIKSIGLPCILKPTGGYGGASRGVIVIENESKIDDALSFATSFYADKTLLIESFIEAEVEHSAEVLIINGNPIVLAIADKIKSPLPFRVDKNVLYPSRIKGKEYKLLEDTIINAVLALKIQIGAAHVEIATTSKGPVLFELGARCGGGGTPEPIIPYVTGVEYFITVIKCLAGDVVESVKPVYKAACNYHFITPSPGRVNKISVPEKFEKKGIDVLDFELFIKNGDTIKNVETGLDRSGFFIIGGPQISTLLDVGKEFEKSINIEYYID